MAGRAKSAGRKVEDRQRGGTGLDSGDRTAERGDEGTSRKVLEDFAAELLATRAGADVLEHVARVLATSLDPRARDGAAAEYLARRACAGVTSPERLDTLAAACAELGKFDEALAAIDRAIRRASAAGDSDMAAVLAGRRRTYERGLALREPVAVPYEAPTGDSDALRRKLAYGQVHWGRLALAQGRYENAGFAFERAVVVDPGYRRGHLALARLLKSAGRYEPAIRHFRAALQPGRKDAEVLVELATVYEAQGALRRAVTLYREAVAAEPGRLEVANALAWLLATSEDPTVRDVEEALRIVRRVNAEDDRPNAAHLDTLAAAYAANGRFEEAAEIGRKAIRHGEADEGTVARLSGFRLRLRLYEAGRPYHGRRQAEIELGNVALEGGRYREAARRYGAALALGKPPAELLVKLASIYEHLDEPVRAKRLYLQALRQDPDVAEVANALAWTYATAREEHRRNFACAVALARKACELSEWANPRYLDTLAAAYAEAGLFSQAVETMDQALELLSEETAEARDEYRQRLRDDFAQRRELYRLGRPYRGATRLQVELAHALWQQGRLEEAEARLQRVLEVEPKNADAHVYLAGVRKSQGRQREAIEHYREALRWRPGSLAVANALAWELAMAKDAELRRPEEALKLALRVCTETDYGEPRYVDTLAVAFAATGNRARAARFAREAVELAVADGQKELAEEFAERLRQYESSTSNEP